MRNEWPALRLLVAPFMAPADDMKISGETPAPPPAYEMPRFNEHDAGLADPALRNDWLDAAKCIPPQDDDPSWQNQ